jgi:cell division protein FtsW (lipid II flippase)
MLLDIMFAKYLLNRNISVNRVKLILTINYLLASLLLYLFVFHQKNNIGTTIAFTLVIAFFSYVRTKNLENFFRNRNKL